jgi:hypothetical protein
VGTSGLRNLSCRVIVRVGSSEMWPEANNSALQPGEEPSHDYFKDNGFEIDWSLFKWGSVVSNQS